MQVLDAEYLWISCLACSEKVKLAKNQGGAFWQCLWDNAVEEFLLEHCNCPQELITLRWE